MVWSDSGWSLRSPSSTIGWWQEKQHSVIWGKKRYHRVLLKSLLKHQAHQTTKGLTVHSNYQGHSQEFATGGTKEGVWGTEVPQRGPGAEPRWESGAKAEINTNFQLRRGACTHVLPPWLYATVVVCRPRFQISSPNLAYGHMSRSNKIPTRDKLTNRRTDSQTGRHIGDS